MATGPVATADLPPGFELDPAELPPGFALDKRKVGVVETALRVAADAARPAVRTFDMAAAGLAGIFGDTKGQEQIFADMQSRQARMKEAYAEQPGEEFSLTGEVLGGAASMPQTMLGQGVAPGVQKTTEVLERGGTMGEAVKAGTVTGAVEQALQLLPMHAGAKAMEKVGGGIVRQGAAGAVTGAAVNVPAGIVGRMTENAALPGTDPDARGNNPSAFTPGEDRFEDLRQPNDLKAIATEAGLSAAFGAVGAGRARAKAKKAAAGKPPPFPADKFEDLGDGNFRAPNGSTVTREAWETSSQRLRDGWMEEAPKETPPGEPKLQEEIDRLREEHPSGPVANVVNEVTRQREKQAKTKADAAELRRAATLTHDPELKKALNARAEKLDPSEKIPKGEVREGQPAIEGEAPKKIPVGEVREGQPEIKTEKVEPIPKGEVIEEKIPVGETDEVPGVGGKIPVGEAKEITASGVEKTDEPRPGSIPKGEVKELYIPPEKRNASDQVVKQEGVQQKRVEGNEVGQTAKASGGDRVLDTTPKPGTEAVAPPYGEPMSPERHRYNAWESEKIVRDKQAKFDALKGDDASINWNRDWEGDTRVRSRAGALAEIAYFKVRAKEAQQKVGDTAPQGRDWGNTATEAAQKIRDLKAKGEITALDEAKLLSLADKHKSDPNLRTTKLNNFLADRGKPIAPRTTKATKGDEPDDDFSFDPNKPETLTFPKIVASMIDASQRETQRKAVYKSTPRADDGLRVVGKDDRGTAQVRAAIKEGVRDGRIDKDGGDIALWALERNPNLARGLKLESSADKGPGMGLYGHASRTISLFKDNNRTTAAHEILHHSERMMPEIVQTGIRREWKRALSKAVSSAKTPTEKQALKDMMASAFRGDAKARKRAMEAMGDGTVDQHKFYHLLNPSEFWAVNAARILSERHAARGSWRDQAKRWLKELVEKAKGLVGVRSDAPLLKALDEVLNPKKVRGERHGAKMLSEGGGRKPREVPRDFQDPNVKKQTETPEFKRWFGNSKVVDDNGQPLRVYHATPKDFNAFKAGGDDPTKSGHAIWFGTDPLNPAAAHNVGGGSRGFKEGTRTLPVYVKMERPLVLDNLNMIQWARSVWGSEFPNLMGKKTVASVREEYDGVLLHHPKTGKLEEVVVFEPSQVKSATGNRGTFDPNDPNISLAPNAPKAPKRALPEESKFEKFERALFDRFNRVMKLQKTEAPKSEKSDIYLGDQLFQGRAQHRGDVLQRDFIEPLGKDLEAAKKLDLTVADADDYLMALHAPERNAAIAAINPKMQDGGSGLTNAQAKKIIDGFSPEQRKALDGIAKRVHDMHRKKLDAMVDDGLITADLRDALNRKFKKYVPLKTLDEEEAFTGIGQGYSMRPTDIKESLGRSSKAGSPIAASMQDAARSIVRGEKARVDRSIWEYSQDAAAHDFIKPYDPNKPPPEVMKQAKGPDGQVKKVVDPNKVRDMTIDLVVDGKPQKVFVPDQLLRDQIRKLATVNDPGKWLGAIGKVTGGIGRMLTEFNPAFTLPNAVRDSITIGMRAKAHGLSPAKVVGGIPEAWGQIVNYKRGANTPGAKAYEEFLKAGGKTGAYGMTDVTHTLRRLERLGAQLGYAQHETGLARRKGGQALRTAARLMSNFNEIFEYAGRFSAFQQARAAGKSEKESAAIAKEISVNFNRSGEYSRALNSVLVFANAALQGLRNSVVYARSSQAVRMAMLGTVGVGALAQMWNELMGGENEDTGEPNANMQNDSIADKNLMLMWPGSDKGIKVPLPPEYSWLYTMGRRGYRAFSQGHWKKEAAGITGSMLDAVLPVRLPDTDSHVGAAAKAVVFTPVVPFVDLLGDNKNFFGQDIVPDRHDDVSPAPYVKSSRTTTSDIAKGISDGLNTVTGGDRIRPGASEKMLGPLVSPEGIEHITGFYTGGVGQLAMQSKNIAKSVSKGEPVDINKIPIANRFVFEEPKSYTSRRYKELRPEFEYAMDYAKAGESEKVDPKIDRALGEFVGAEKELRVLFKRMKSAASEGNDAEKKTIEADIKRAQSRVLRAYYGQPQQ